MNKKAFTLVELLAIIIVMGVILTIAIPAVNKIIKNSQLKTFEENERKLGHAVDVYFSNHYYPMPKNINDSLFVSLKELKANKIVEDVYDPKDNSLCDEIRSGVTITKVTANKYDYTPYLKCTNFTSSTENNIVENISHTYNGGTGKYSINVKVTENPNNLWDFVTDTYKIGYIKPTLLNYTQWVVGTSGSQGTFGQNGSTAENQIILYPNPWGKQDVVWATLTNDATSNADGGWSTSNYTIDKTKKYRLTVWIKRADVGNGRTYFGTQASTVANLSDGSTNSNPYFYDYVVTGVPAINGNWLLHVAYIHPYDYALTTSDPTNGIYHGVTKERIRGVTDFKWISTATVGGHRTYLYYSTSTTEKQYWYRPRFEVVDGTEPTIEELLNGVENPNVNDYDIISNSNDVTFIVDNPGTYEFTLTRRDGTKHRFSYIIPE